MFENLSESAKLYLKEGLSPKLVTGVVKGLIPLEPKELIIVVAYHYKRGDDHIKEDAVITLKSIPQNVIEGLITEDVPDFVLGFIAHNYPLTHHDLYLLAINKNLSDELFIELANKDDPSLLELLAKNQVRILKNDNILDVLINNPHLPKVSRDQLVEFFAGLAYRELKNKNIKIEQESFLPSEKKEDLPSPINKSELPSSLAGLPEDIRAGLPADFGLPADLIRNLPTDFMMHELPSDLITEQDAEQQEETATDAKSVTLYQKVQQMNVSQKIKLALLGNKEVRNILIKDSNRIVVESVIKSPRITDGEVISIVNSRSISEDVLRLISGNKEWLKNYRVRQALVSNPKTPITLALKLLDTLNKQDLKNLSSSKNVSSTVAVTAKKRLGENK